MSVARYTTGTCQINGGGAVVGSGTLWASAVTPGDWFSLTVAGPFYEVITVTDDTHITIDPAPSTTASGQSYVISEISPLRGSIAQNNILLTAFRMQLGSILTVSGADKTITLNKTANTDNAGLLLQQGATSLFQVGLFGNGSANNRFQVQYLVSATWTPGISVDPTSGKVGFGIAAATQILDAVATSAALALWDNASAATGKGGALLLQASNASSARTTFASLNAYVTTTTAAAEVGDLVIKTMRAGTLTEAGRFLGAGGLTLAGSLLTNGAMRAYTTSTGLQILATLQGDSNASVTAALGFSVSASASSEPTAYKAGIGLNRYLANGRGDLNFYLNPTNDTANFTASDIVMKFVNGNGTFNATYVAFLSTLAATNATTASVTIAGGLGVAGSIYGSGMLRIASGSVGTNVLTAATSGGPSTQFQNLHGSAGDHGLAIGAGVAGTTDSTTEMISFYSSDISVYLGGIRRNGASAVAYNTSSDVRGKPNRELLDRAHARSVVDALKIWDFDKDGNDIRGIGVLAQEAHEVHPSFGHKPHNPKHSWSSEKAAPVPYLVANMQLANRSLDDHEKSIADLTTELAAARSRILALESRAQ